MPGFSTYNDIITAITVNGKGEYPSYNKASITTVAAGKFSLGYIGGTPSSLVFGTALTATAVTSATPGVLAPFTDPTAPATKNLMSAGIGSTVAAGTFMIYDLLARYPLNGTVTSGTFTSVTLPARDATGTTNGVGVLPMVVNATGTTASAVTLTLNYTNSAGTAGRSSAVTIVAGAQHRVLNDTFGWTYPLQAGDVGVRTIQSYTLSATATTTQIEVQLIRPLAYIPVMVAGGYTQRNFVTDLPRMPRLYAGTAICVGVAAATTSSGVVSADLVYAEN